jgi:hypothetical protein
MIDRSTKKRSKLERLGKKSKTFKEIFFHVRFLIYITGKVVCITSIKDNLKIDN